jgi:predicted esterase YcpF (UPF0227 family)
MLGEYLRQRAPEVGYRVPALHHRPSLAMAQVRAACTGTAAADLLVVGSSLGGFYATVAAEAIGCRAVVINPAVHPQGHFGRFVGPQRNLYTGEAFELTRGHVAELAAHDPTRITYPQRYWLLAETGDEVLDCREAVAFYAGARHSVEAGGDHSLQGFAGFMPAIVAWAREDREAVPPGAVS